MAMNGADKNGVKAKAPILVFSGRPNRLNQLRAAIRESAIADAFDAAFVWDGVQAYRLHEAKEALARGYAGNMHRLLLVDGDVAMNLSAAQLQSLKDAALASWKLLIMGIADDPKERAKLEAIGVKRICAPLTFAADFPVQWKGVTADFEAAYHELRAKTLRQEAAAVEIEVERNPTAGLLPEGGTIAVHASKGGVGKTFIATNIAWGLARSGKSTIIVDLNPSGAADHLQFWRWIKKQEQLEDPLELFEYKGLSWLARRIDHGQHFTIRPDLLEEAIVPITDSLSLLPGVGDQSDYGIGYDGDKTVAKLLNERRWVEHLIDLLSAPSGRRRYVVLDTGTDRFTASGFITVNRCDLLVIVINAATNAAVQVELSAWKRLMDSNISIMRGKRMLVVNQLLSVPGAPRFEEVAKKFEFIEPEVILPVRRDEATFVAADAKNEPILADPTLAATTPIGADLIAVVNAIAEIYKVNDQEEKKGNLINKLFGRGR